MAIKSRKKGNQPKVYFGIFNDAGGFIISVDVWGRPILKRVPPWQPFVDILAAAANLLAQAERSRNRQTRQQLNARAQQMAAKVLPALRARFGK